MDSQAVHRGLCERRLDGRLVLRDLLGRVDAH